MEHLQPGLDQKLPQILPPFNSALLSDVCGFPLHGFTSHWGVRAEWTKWD